MAIVLRKYLQQLIHVATSNGHVGDEKINSTMRTTTIIVLRA